MIRLFVVLINMGQVFKINTVLCFGLHTSHPSLVTVLLITHVILFSGSSHSVFELYLPLFCDILVSLVLVPHAKIYMLLGISRLMFPFASIQMGS